MDERVDFRYEVTDEGTTWEMTVSREMLAKALEESLADRVTLSGTFDDDKLGEFALGFVRTIDELKKLEEKHKRTHKHPPPLIWVLRRLGFLREGR